jgi:hypothetical protein
LHYAIRDKDAERALEIARSLRFVPLRYAMRLTLLLAEQHHPLYDAAARRIAVRVIEELDTPLGEVKKLIDALAHVHDYVYWYEARDALRDVVSQLHRMQRVNIDFDSLAMRPRERADGARPMDGPEAEDSFLADLKAALPVAPARWIDDPLRG